MAPTKIASVPSGYNQKFLQNPLHFMRLHTVSPPDNVNWKGELGVPTQAPPVPPRPASTLSTTPWQNATPSQLQNKWQPATPSQLQNKPGWTSAQPSQAVKNAAEARVNAALNKYHQPATTPSGMIERRKWAGGIRYVQFTDPIPGSRLHMEKGNALTLKFLPENGTRVGSWIPIFWLPWQSGKILQTTIPAVPPPPATWDEEDYPSFFFTAALSGCSVFAFGDPQGPSVAHAGIETAGSTQGRPGEFWRAQMAKTKSGYGSSAIKGEINAHMYAQGSQQAAELAKAYRDFMASGKPDFKLDVQSTIGCVFGIRTGRNWTLYLQKSALLQKVRFFKQGEIESREATNIAKTTPDFFVRGTNIEAKEEPSKSVLTPKKLGPLTVGTKEQKIFSTTTTHSMPLQVIEFYPSNQYVADFQDVFRST